MNQPIQGARARVTNKHTGAEFVGQIYVISPAVGSAQIGTIRFNTRRHRKSLTQWEVHNYLIDLITVGEPNHPPRHP